MRKDYDSEDEEQSESVFSSRDGMISPRVHSRDSLYDHQRAADMYSGRERIGKLEKEARQGALEEDRQYTQRVLKDEEVEKQRVLEESAKHSTDPIRLKKYEALYRQVNKRRINPKHHLEYPLLKLWLLKTIMEYETLKGPKGTRVNLDNIDLKDPYFVSQVGQVLENTYRCARRAIQRERAKNKAKK
jgi:hypothetical protein